MTVMTWPGAWIVDTATAVRPVSSQRNAGSVVAARWEPECAWCLSGNSVLSDCDLVTVHARAGLTCM